MSKSPPVTVIKVLLFAGAFIGISAAAEILNHVRAQLYLNRAADTALQTTIDGMMQSGDTLIPGIQTALESFGAVRYSATFVVNDEQSMVAIYRGEAPTLYLRWVGIDTLPIKFEIDASTKASI